MYIVQGIPNDCTILHLGPNIGVIKHPNRIQASKRGTATLNKPKHFKTGRSDFTYVGQERQLAIKYNTQISHTVGAVQERRRNRVREVYRVPRSRVRNYLALPSIQIKFVDSAPIGQGIDLTLDMPATVRWTDDREQLKIIGVEKNSTVNSLSDIINEKYK